MLPSRLVLFKDGETAEPPVEASASMVQIVVPATPLFSRHVAFVMREISVSMLIVF